MVLILQNKTKIFKENFLRASSEWDWFSRTKKNLQTSSEMGFSWKYKFREEVSKHLLNGILQGKRNL
jgi:hypothetical protein